MIKVSAPATIANLSAGFDVLGLALDYVTEEMTMAFAGDNSITIKNLDEYGLPEDPDKNLIGPVIRKALAIKGEERGIVVSCRKKLKPGSGLGTSAASAVAAALAINELLQLKLTDRELIELAMEGEAFVSGGPHADNIAPCLLGGIQLVRSTVPLDVISLDYPEFYISVLYPDIEVKTEAARALLPPELPLKTAVNQWANLGALVAGLEKKDIALVGRSLNDFVAEPYRKQLIPEFDKVKSEAMKAGAVGGGISGSGPAIFMLSHTEEDADRVLEKMKDVYRNKTGFIGFTSNVNKSGAMIIST